MTLKVIAENKPVANQELVDELLELVAEARAGVLVGAIIIDVDQHGVCAHTLAGDISDGLCQAAVELDIVKLTLLDSIIEARSEVADADD